MQVLLLKDGIFWYTDNKRDKFSLMTRLVSG